jgi:hypothetical protein
MGQAIIIYDLELKIDRAELNCEGDTRAMIRYSKLT